MQRMVATCRDAGLPDPFFEEIATRLRVTIFSERVSRRALDDTGHAILGALSDASDRLASEIVAVIGLTPRTTRSLLARLVARGLMSEVGTGPQDPQRRYFIATSYH